MLGTQHLPPALVLGKATAKPCCELLESAKAKESKKTLLNERNPHQEDHRWLDLKNLPVSFKKGKGNRWDWLIISLVTVESKTFNCAVTFPVSSFGIIRNN